MRLFLLLAPLALVLCAQQPAEILARLDRTAPAFRSAKAQIRSVEHTAVIDEDDIETGTITIRRADPSSLQVRVDFTSENARTAVISGKKAEVYHPKINEIQEWNLAHYRDIAQKFFALGFGTAGRELAAGYTVRDIRPENLEGQAVTHMDLSPKDREVAQHLPRVELWLSDRTQCPVQQKFYFPDGSYRQVTFSDMQLNPSVPASAFDLPKSATRRRMN